MFKTLTTVPHAASRVLAASTRPVPTGAPLYLSLRRSYHEKDKSHSLPVRHTTITTNDKLTSRALLDHYSKPRNVGSMSKTDADVGTGLVGAPACGDVMKLQIRVDPTSNTISDVKFKTFGCGSAIASSSYLTELVRGMSLEDAGKIRNTEIARELCLPPVKLHCSMLAEDAIKSAISNYYTKNPKARATDLGGTGVSMPKVEVEMMDTPAPQTATA
ncbi:iron-binding protein [Xylographa carneopallida]|nr:iron-binding protein [Xylographa carneopallida]